MPKVSIVVPIYNVEQYIEKCLTSLENQTLQDIQIILVNDGSQDNSAEIAKKYVEKNPTKFLYVEKKNGGLSDARNFGMPYATGEYIAFLDSDDYVEPTLYEKMYQKAKEENSDLVECDFIWEYPDKQKIDCGEIYQGQKEMMVKARVVAWNKLIRRDLLQKVGQQYTVGVQYEDMDFFYNMIPYYHKVSFIKEPLIHYVQRDSSISNKQNEKTKDIFIVLNHVLTVYQEKGWYEEYKEELEYIYVKNLLCSSLLRMVKIQDKEIKKEALKETWMQIQEHFPNWKQNRYIKTGKKGKERYMQMVNKRTYPIICKLLERKK